jgi:hypothetical protein
MLHPCCGWVIALEAQHLCRSPAPGIPSSVRSDIRCIVAAVCDRRPRRSQSAATKYAAPAGAFSFCESAFYNDAAPTALTLVGRVTPCAPSRHTRMRRLQPAAGRGLPALPSLRSENPDGIPSFSPGLAVRAGRARNDYPGSSSKKSSTPTGLHHLPAAVCCNSFRVDKLCASLPSVAVPTSRQHWAECCNRVAVVGSAVGAASL